MTQDWDEVEALRESLREHMDEIKRLNECLTWEQHRAEHVSTHGPGCAMWGPKHYECLLRAYNAMKERTSQESRQVEPVGYFSINSYGNWEQNESGYGTPLYEAPPKREPLTDAEIKRLYDSLPSKYTLAMFARAVERAHGIGGKE